MWLFEQSNFICLAHNLRAYDGIFIMNYLTTNNIPSDNYNVIMDGCKINLISINNIKIIDSLNFIPSSLAKFPKTFNLTELKKGYFPHKFNNLDNQNYIGLLPSKEFYGYEYMSDKDSKEFLIWHDINKDKKFNFKEELISYCESDVNILKLGCLSFRESYLELIKNFEHNIDPFRDCCTLASLYQLTYRALFMKSESIALINDQGFNPHNTFSAKQILWLRFLAKIITQLLFIA